ncbi:cell envelope biogenesis protein TolA, partial [Providencia sp.]|uniref:cell envelope biogenesis protein TolA n=1 Tax=Providencia sp. TaxID=589 RepID=UPI0035B19D10
MRKLLLGLIAVSVMMVSAVNSASARNYPCSGSKGGIDRCEDGKFICNDGSTSRSEQVCTIELKNDINSKAGAAGAVIGAGVAKQSSKPSVSDSIKSTGDKASKTVSEKATKASDSAKTVKEKASKAADKDVVKETKEKASKAADKESAKAVKEKASKAADKDVVKETKEKVSKAADKKDAVKETKEKASKAADKEKAVKEKAVKEKAVKEK